MRILFNSKDTYYKTPFGCVTPGEKCTLRLKIPLSVGATAAAVVINEEEFPMEKAGQAEGYGVFQGQFSLKETGLYFYYFRIVKADGSFRLFKLGDDTNMEAGDKWQLSCIPADFTTPDWAKGAVIYQVFPDRFHKSGDCDLTGKLTPYTIHESWDEEVSWQPEPDGSVLNNDFFGGNFRGITEKMSYIASLGTTILYLNPISKSFSSHRYDTGDYKTPDPMLGTIEDFAELCREAHRYGIRVILDGVYSHTGANSLYFNREGAFPGVGAYESKDSPYFSWYSFTKHPDAYQSWWGFPTLPTVNKMDPGFISYIITDRDSVVAHWLKLGADGFRLDVVDELPDAFVKLLKTRIRELKPDALLIGEVWEDASNKIAYNVRRRYFTDAILDSCMNYPLRTALMDLFHGRDDGRNFRETVMTIAENYPAQVLACNMNLLGSHDTPRILTALMDEYRGAREEEARRRLSDAELTRAKDRLMAATVLQYLLPGAASLYYGDEAGMEGYKDPFCRRTYPWGREDKVLLGHFRMLGRLKRDTPALRTGGIRFLESSDRHIAFQRYGDGETISVFVNLNRAPWEIDGEDGFMEHNAEHPAPDRIRLRENGFCIRRQEQES